MKYTTWIIAAVVMLSYQPARADIWSGAGDKLAQNWKAAIRGGGFNYQSDIKATFDGIIDHALEGASADAIKVVHDSADYLFDKKITPTLDHANEIANGLIATAGNEAESKADAVIDHTVEELKSELGPFVTDALGVAKNFNETLKQFTPAQIQAQLVGPTFDRLDSLEKSVNRDADALLTKIDTIIDSRIQQVDCAVQGEVQRLLTEVKATYSQNLLPNPLDHCRSDLGLDWRWGTELHDSDFYNLERCHMIDDITPSSPMRVVLGRYQDLASLAARYRCMESGGAIPATATGASMYTTDWFWAVDNYNVWSRLAGRL